MAGVHQGARLRLDHRRALNGQAPVALLPDHQRLEDAERARREGLIGAEEVGERHDARERVELVAGVSAGIERADDGPHAGADDEIGADAKAVERPKDADVRQSLGASAGEHQRRSRLAAALRLHRSLDEGDGEDKSGGAIESETAAARTHRG